MEVLSSRVLLHPVDFERSFRFYSDILGLHVYREWGSGSTRGVVFFLGGGFLELSGSSRTETSENVGLWLQVRDVDAVGRHRCGSSTTLRRLRTVPRSPSSWWSSPAARLGSGLPTLGRRASPWESLHGSLLTARR
jgi:catechol 2,3-dioxygenase-like lactoylglutathione lyase family enzyme